MLKVDFRFSTEINCCSDDFDYFIGALVAHAPKTADKIQFAINTQFQELDNA